LVAGTYDHLEHAAVSCLLAGLFLANADRVGMREFVWTEYVRLGALMPAFWRARFLPQLRDRCSHKCVIFATTSVAPLHTRFTSRI
jgi:hypothetical protein